MSAGANAGDTERACPSLPAVRNGVSLIRTKAAIAWRDEFRIPRSRVRHRRFTLGGNAAGRIEELGPDDRTHPRIPEEPQSRRTLPRRRHRCRPRELPELRKGIAGHPGLLRR